MFPIFILYTSSYLKLLHRHIVGVYICFLYLTFTLMYYRWYPLKCKPGQSKNDYRGDLELRTSFTVKAVDRDSDKLGKLVFLINVQVFISMLYIYTARQKHESTLLHTYLMNEFLTAERSCTTKCF